jgi:hypothetical protein
MLNLTNIGKFLTKSKSDQYRPNLANFLRSLVEIGHVKSDEYRQIFYEIEINVTNIDQIWQIFLRNLVEIGHVKSNRYRQIFTKSKCDQYRPNLAIFFYKIAHVKSDEYRQIFYDIEI